MILVTGGCGYIGAHTVSKLIEQNEKVVIIDNLTTGFEELLVPNAELIKGDISDSELLNNIFSQYEIKGVIHFAASSLVGESNKKVSEYFENNVVKTKRLLDCMIENNVKNIVFSSTAAVYGLPKSNEIDESHDTNPINTYGDTKLSIEKMIKRYSDAYGLNYIIFRYFNACGCDYEKHLGELHKPETHIIPLILDSIKQNKKFKVFGDDYSTEDGSCIRDYIDVRDLAVAHFKGMQLLLNNKNFNKILNLGNNRGVSNFEIIKICEEVTGKKLDYKIDARREGDPPILIANANLAKNVLQWTPKFTLKNSIENAWKYKGGL